MDGTNLRMSYCQIPTVFLALLRSRIALRGCDPTLVVALREKSVRRSSGARFASVAALVRGLLVGRGILPTLAASSTAWSPPRLIG